MHSDAIDLDAMHRAAGQASRLMKALSNPDRLMILCRLAQDDELSVGAIEAELGILQPTLSQQLTVLRDEGLVDTRREGRNIFYRVSAPAALAVLRVLYREFCERKGRK